jgi:SAM-dependent methyltransferase
MSQQKMKLAKLNSRNRRAGPKPQLNGEELKLDLGCGPSKRAGFKGVDCIGFPGVDFVVDLAKPRYVPLPPHFKSMTPYLEQCFERKIQCYEPWPWADDSVSEIHCSHCLEHFDSFERVHMVNEMWRVLKHGSKATIICPHWSSCRAYGDPTHKWPPVSEFWFYYLKKEWRITQAPHTDISNIPNGFNCNFDVTWGYSIDPEVQARSQEYQQHALRYWKEAAQDVICTFTKNG